MIKYLTFCLNFETESDPYPGGQLIMDQPDPDPHHEFYFKNKY